MVDRFPHAHSGGSNPWHEETLRLLQTCTSTPASDITNTTLTHFETSIAGLTPERREKLERPLRDQREQMHRAAGRIDGELLPALKHALDHPDGAALLVAFMQLGSELDHLGDLLDIGPYAVTGILRNKGGHDRKAVRRGWLKFWKGWQAEHGDAKKKRAAKVAYGQTLKPPLRDSQIVRYLTGL